MFLSTNNGLSWSGINNGLTDTTVTAIAIKGNEIYASTKNGFVFKNSTILTGVKEINETTSAFVIYPNPTSSLITIKSDSNISNIEIINLMGEKIFQQNTNGFQTVIDLSHQPKGVYFIRLMKGHSLVATDKLLLE